MSRPGAGERAPSRGRRAVWLAALLTLLALGLLPLAPLAAFCQEAPAASKPAPPPAEGSAKSPSDPLDRALARVDAGDLEGAIGILEPLAGDAATSPVAKSLLGALYVETGRPADALAILAPLAEAKDADPALLYNAGRAALALGKEEAAEGYFRRSVAASPVSPAGRELGLLLGKHKKTFEAYKLLRPWALSHPDDEEARMAATLLALQLGRAPEAKKLLEGLPADEPRVRLLRGQLLLATGDPPGALKLLEPLLADHPPEMDRDVRRVLAEAYTLTGRSASAVDVLSGKVGDDPSLTVLLAQAQYQKGDVEGALATLEPWAKKLLDEGGVDSRVPDRRLAGGIVLEYGRDLVTLGRAKEAVPVLEKATHLEPGEKQGWQLLGQALAAVGRRDEAKEALARFQKLSQSEVPESVRDMQLREDVADPTGHNLREALRFLAQGYPEKALALVQEERQLAPEDPRPRFLEVRVLVVLKRSEEALKAADGLVEDHPDSADAHYLRALAYMSKKAFGPAEQDFRRALDISPDHTGALSDYAVLLMTEGKDAEARRLLQHLLELRPDDAVAKANLEKLSGS